MKLPDLSRLKIVCYPDPVLQKRCTAVEEFDANLQQLSERMFELMRENKGVGLAAPQVGIPIRLFVCNVSGEPEDDAIFVNPAIGDMSGGETAEEGCLSIPGVTVEMRRATALRINAVDLKGNPFVLPGQGLTARVWQHESDHLDGRLIIDRMSSTDEIANRRAIKQLETDYADDMRSRKTR